MKDIKNLVNQLLDVGVEVELTERLAHTPDLSFIMKNGYAEKTFKTVISFIEDRIDYFYVGHRPVGCKDGRFGYFRLPKTSIKKFGVVAINGVELYMED